MRFHGGYGGFGHAKPWRRNNRGVYHSRCSKHMGAEQRVMESPKGYLYLKQFYHFIRGKIAIE